MGVLILLEEEKGVFRRDSGDRYLTIRPMRVHYAHLSDGERIKKGCRICTEGLASLYYAVAQRPGVQPEEDAVAEGGGTDEEGTGSPAHTVW
jgi:hypothetical protein